MTGVGERQDGHLLQHPASQNGAWGGAHMAHFGCQRHRGLVLSNFQARPDLSTLQAESSPRALSSSSLSYEKAKA